MPFNSKCDDSIGGISKKDFPKKYKKVKKAYLKEMKKYLKTDNFYDYMYLINLLQIKLKYIKKYFGLLSDYYMDLSDKKDLLDQVSLCLKLIDNINDKDYNTESRIECLLNRGYKFTSEEIRQFYDDDSLLQDFEDKHELDGTYIEEYFKLAEYKIQKDFDRLFSTLSKNIRGWWD